MRTQAERESRPVDADEPPPVLGRWWRLYALVIVELIAIILLCGWLAGHGR